MRLKANQMTLGTSYFVRFSPDSAWLASCGERSVYLRRPGISKPKHSVRLRHGSSGDFSPDSRTLVVKTTAGTLHVLGPLDAEPELRTLNEGDGEGPSPLHSACGRFIIDASWSGRLAIFASQDGTSVAHREFSSDMLVELLSASGSDTWLVHHSPRSTTDTDPPDPDYFSVCTLPLVGEPHREIRPGLRFVRHSALSSSETLLAINHGAPPEKLSIIDAHTGETVSTTRIDVGGTGGRMAWAPSGELAVVERHGVRTYSADLTALGELELEYACDVAFSPTGELVAIGSWSSGRLLPASAVLP